MKTCKGFWESQHKKKMLVGELHYIVWNDHTFDAVPLSEFEAYKTKTEKVINRHLTSGNFSCFLSVRMVLEQLKKELEL